MARFQYRMQSVLNIKVKMETQAKQDFAAAKMILDEELNKLEGIKQRKILYEEQAKALLKDNLKVREIIETQTAILRMDEYIQIQKLQVRLAEQDVEAARTRLTEIMMDRKTHEALKEKAFEEYIREENRAESKEIDQLTSYKYGQQQIEQQQIEQQSEIDMQA